MPNTNMWMELIDTAKQQTTHNCHMQKHIMTIQTNCGTGGQVEEMQHTMMQQQNKPSIRLLIIFAADNQFMQQATIAKLYQKLITAI